MCPCACAPSHLSMPALPLAHPHWFDMPVLAFICTCLFVQACICTCTHPFLHACIHTHSYTPVFALVCLHLRLFIVLGFTCTHARLVCPCQLLPLFIHATLVHTCCVYTHPPSHWLVFTLFCLWNFTVHPHSPYLSVPAISLVCPCCHHPYMPCVCTPSLLLAYVHPMLSFCLWNFTVKI